MDPSTLHELANEVEHVADRVDGLIFDALRAQSRGSDDENEAKETERQLSKVRRSLVKAEQILRELAGAATRSAE